MIYFIASINITGSIYLMHLLLSQYVGFGCEAECSWSYMY